MYLRPAISVFLEVQSEAELSSPAARDWTLDWRWFEDMPVPAGKPPARPNVRRIIIREE